MNTPLVSIIIPFYNDAATLARTLESIHASTHRNYEVLLVDDASTDESPKIAAAFVREDAHVRLLTNEHNRHVSFCRNRALDLARGDYVSFVDSDDWISPDWIANLLTAADEADAEVVIGKSMQVLTGGAQEYPMKGLSRRRSLTFGQLVFKDNCVVWNKLYSRALMEREKARFDTEIQIGEDLLFNYNLLQAARGIFYSGSGYYFHQADNETSIIRASTPASRIENYEKLLAKLCANPRALTKPYSAAPRKVARDILREHYRNPDCLLSEATWERIKQLDRFLPAKTRARHLRQTVHRALRPGKA